MSPIHRPDGRLTISFVSAMIRGRLRRWHAIRWLLALAATLALAALVDGARSDAATARSRWGETFEVWVATRPIAAGATLSADDVSRIALPRTALPTDAIEVDPSGHQVRVDLAAGEILRTARLDSFAAGEVAARLTDGHMAIILPVDDDIFAVGDSVALFALASGSVLTERGTVVAVSEGRVTVDLKRTDVGRVVSELSRGGVTMVLSR